MTKPCSLPYPAVEAVCKNPRLAVKLLDAMSGRVSELSAILQYTYHTHYFKAYGMTDTEHTLKQIARDEMHHLDILGELVQKLGGDPRYYGSRQGNTPWQASFIPYHSNPALMLLDDIAEEKCSIANYTALLGCVCDPAVAGIIQRILLDEQDHLCQLSAMYTRLQSGYACPQKPCCPAALRTPGYDAYGSPCGCAPAPSPCGCPNAARTARGIAGPWG